MRSRSARRLTTILLTSATLVLAGATTAASAAEDPTYRCKEAGKWACIWRDAGYMTNGSGRALVGINDRIPRLSTWDYAGSGVNANNSASSVKNRGERARVRLYKGEEYTGDYFTLPAGHYDGDFNNGTPAGGFNDQVSSMKFID